MLPYYQNLLKECKNISKWKTIHLKMLTTLVIMRLKLKNLKGGY